MGEADQAGSTTPVRPVSFTIGRLRMGIGSTMSGAEMGRGAGWTCSLLIVTLLVAWLASPVAAQRVEVDALFSRWDRPDSPGCAIGVIRDGRLVYQRGYGMANLDHSIPISGKTVFYIASTSKQFTALSIAWLAALGRLSLTDDIRRYIPELPAEPVNL